MKHNGTIYRPPIEANTFLLPVTEGSADAGNGGKMIKKNKMLFKN